MTTGAALIYIFLLILAAGVARIVVCNDLHQREPRPVLLAAAVLGFAGMAVAYRIQSAVCGWCTEQGAVDPSIFVSAGAAAVTEELAKFLVVAVIFKTSAAFDEAMDGVVYGSFAGIGAGLFEVWAYLHDFRPSAGGSSGGSAGATAEHVARILGHPIMGGITASGIGFLTLRRRFRPRFLGAMVVAMALSGMALHGFYDAIAFAAGDSRAQEEETVKYSLLAGLLMATGLLLYAILVWIGDRLDRTVQGGIWKARRSIRRFVADAVRGEG